MSTCTYVCIYDQSGMIPKIISKLFYIKLAILRMTVLQGQSVTDNNQPVPD